MMKKPTESGKIVKNATWLIACKVVQSLLSFVIGTLSARYLGPGNYGIIDYAAAIVSFMVPVVQLGLRSTLVHEIIAAPDSEGKTLGTSLFMSTATSFLGIFGVIAFTAIANPNDPETMLVCALYSIKRTTKRIITISSVLVVILALLCTGVSLYINSIFDRIEKIPEVSRVDPSNEFFETDSPEESPTTAPVVKPEDIGWGEIEPFLDDKLINILLVGQDRYVGTARQRSDTMLLCSINAETKKVSMISFLRDLYVQIPGGYSDNRLNAAYAFGGFPLLVDAFYTNFGVTIDGCFEVDLAGFRSIVDILDGVDVTLTAREAEVVGVGSEEKLYHLNGKEALSYAQIRKLDSDFGRTQRQRNVMEALYKKFQYADTDTLMKLFQEVLPYLSTNMTNGQIMRLAAKCIPAFGSIELHSYCVPANDSFYYASIREMSVLVPDLDKIRGQLENEYLPLN